MEDFSYISFLRESVPLIIDDWLENPRETVLILQSLKDNFFSIFEDMPDVDFKTAQASIDHIIEELKLTSPSKNVLYNLMSLELALILDHLDKMTGSIENSSDGV